MMVEKLTKGSKVGGIHVRTKASANCMRIHPFIVLIIED